MGAPYALSSDLVSAWPAKSLEVAQYIDGQLPLIAMTQNAQTGVTYSLAATDFTKLVTLSNASPVTVTVPLESSVAWVAGTQLRLMNLGAGVVTVVGAGGVTINGSPLTLAQYKEGTLTKTGTNTWTFTGSASAPGMDLITPTSVAGTGVTLSGGLVSFSAASTISVNGCFNATYDNYLLVMKHVDAASSGQLNLRMRLAGSDASTATYFSQYLYAGSTTVSAAQSLSATSARVSSASASIAPLNVELYSPFIAEPTSFLARSSYTPTTSPSVFVEVGGHSVSTSYDGMSILASATTMTGTLRVYGWRNS